MEPPLHRGFRNNDGRKKFISALKTASKLHENVSTLALVKVWNPDDHSLYLEHEARYTVDGLRFYWEAVDKAVRYADTILYKKISKKQKDTSIDSGKTPNKPKAGTFMRRVINDYKRYDRYHWHRNKSDNHKKPKAGSRIFKEQNRKKNKAKTNRD